MYGYTHLDADMLVADALRDVWRGGLISSSCVCGVYICVYCVSMYVLVADAFWEMFCLGGLFPHPVYVVYVRVCVGVHVCTCIYTNTPICAYMKTTHTSRCHLQITQQTCAYIQTYSHTHTYIIVPTRFKVADQNICDIYIYIYIYIYTHTYIHTHIHTYIHTCIYTHIHTHTYTHT
jgi:hypothetical protein